MRRIPSSHQVSLGISRLGISRKGSVIRPGQDSADGGMASEFT